MSIFAVQNSSQAGHSLASRIPSLLSLLQGVADLPWVQFLSRSVNPLLSPGIRLQQLFWHTMTHTGCQPFAIVLQKTKFQCNLVSVIYQTIKHSSPHILVCSPQSSRRSLNAPLSKYNKKCTGSSCSSQQCSNYRAQEFWINTLNIS